MIVIALMLIAVSVCCWIMYYECYMDWLVLVSILKAEAFCCVLHYNGDVINLMHLYFAAGTESPLFTGRRMVVIFLVLSCSFRITQT